MLLFINFLPIVVVHGLVQVGSSACRTDSDHHEIRE
jgi:hypothetical protein